MNENNKIKIIPVISSELSNLSEAMTGSFVSEVRAQLKGKILKNSPWNYLPDCSKFEIELGLLNPIFSHFGIKKRSESRVIITPWKNGAMNRYAEHQILRLQEAKLKNKSLLYWHIGLLTIKRSNVFRVMAIQHVFPRWHRNYPLHYILNVNRKVSTLFNQGIFNMDYSRVYIPKDELKTRFRPLGVPTPEWRVLLHMYGNLLTYWLSNKLSNSQHGFLPGRGSLTCWREIIARRVMEYNFVKEWDFKSYFDTINLEKLDEELERKGVPPAIRDFLQRVNESLIKLPEETKVDEKLSHAREYATIMNDRTYYRPYVGKREDEIRLLSKLNMGVKMEDTKWVDYDASWVVKDLLKKYLEIPTPKVPLRGVPQGSPTSPILGNVMMDLWLKSDKWNKIAYADDSIGFSDREHYAKIPEGSGIIINKEKSGWIRYNGKTVKPLKFLGLVWDGKDLRADTRKGATLGADENIKSMLNTLDGIRYKENLTYEEAIDYLRTTKPDLMISGKVTSGVNWEKWFTSQIAGWIQSRMYNNDWKTTNFAQDFTFNYVKKSWSEIKVGQKHRGFEIMNMNVFTSSSFACFSLLNMLRYNQKLRMPRRAFKWDVTSTGSSWSVK
jgi:retron-type reverse transcriptase